MLCFTITLEQRILFVRMMIAQKATKKQRFSRFCLHSRLSSTQSSSDLVLHLLYRIFGLIFRECEVLNNMRSARVEPQVLSRIIETYPDRFPLHQTPILSLFGLLVRYFPCFLVIL